jgi:hypothetical protein
MKNKMSYLTRIIDFVELRFSASNLPVVVCIS